MKMFICRQKQLLLLILWAGLTSSLSAEYPLVHYTVSSRDPVYSQQQQDVEDWYRGNFDPSLLSLYRYKPAPSEDLFAVAAAFNLPYETLSTLNNWESPVLFPVSEEILISNIPGMFIPLQPLTGWEKRLAGAERSTEGIPVVISSGPDQSRNYIFYPGEKFLRGERISFLGSLFICPLEKGRITSPFGFRPHPFTGENSFHPGVDMRAAIGTPVKAAREGTIIETGTLEIYGFFIIIDHDGDFQTVYAHLNELLVKPGDFVNTGDIIALSGNTGISTGPHLHFEIRRKGIPVNPAGFTSFAN